LFILHTKVVKTGPDEPGTGPKSGPVDAQKWSAREPAKNCENRKKSGKIGDPAGLGGLAVWTFSITGF
jgi:hypothetical protein